MLWLPLVLVAALLLCMAGLVLLSRSHPRDRPDFPPELLPVGASSVTIADGAHDLCYLHKLATVPDAGTRDFSTWAAALDLPCIADAGECTAWSTDARTSPFWKRDLGDVEGLDTVTATFAGGVLTIDWGDYLCSGPN
jgi:hypothetical protein